MTETYFRLQLARIYATFGKNWPQPPVIEQVFRQVCDFPDPFMDYALECCENLESLPQNLGRYLARELYPDFRQANPELTPSYSQTACPRCKHDIPGLKEFFEPDGTSHLCACDCCTDPERIKRWRKIPDWQLTDMGYLLTNPAVPSLDWLNPAIRPGLLARATSQASFCLPEKS